MAVLKMLNILGMLNTASGVALPPSLRCSLYTVCFFIELKVFVNLTYLYLSEIKMQGLIFSVGMGHLKIRKKILYLDRDFI